MAPPPRNNMNKARRLFQQGQLAAAAAECAGVLRRQPQSFAAAYLLGLIYASDGRIEAAAQCFERATTLNPDSFEARKNLPVALVRLGRREAAISTPERALLPHPLDA